MRSIAQRPLPITSPWIHYQALLLTDSPAMWLDWQYTLYNSRNTNVFAACVNRCTSTFSISDACSWRRHADISNKSNSDQTSLPQENKKWIPHCYCRQDEKVERAKEMILPGLEPGTSTDNRELTLCKNMLRWHSNQLSYRTSDGRRSERNVYITTRLTTYQLLTNWCSYWLGLSPNTSAQALEQSTRRLTRKEGKDRSFILKFRIGSGKQLAELGKRYKKLCDYRAKFYNHAVVRSKLSQRMLADPSTYPGCHSYCCALGRVLKAKSRLPMGLTSTPRHRLDVLFEKSQGRVFYRKVGCNLEWQKGGKIGIKLKLSLAALNRMQFLAHTVDLPASALQQLTCTICAAS